MMKILSKLAVFIPLIFITGCSFLINKDGDKLEKLNDELSINEYENVINDSFTISYWLRGGTNNPENPKKFSSKDELIELKAPEKKGYEFIGWYLESSLQTKVTEIDPSTCKSYTLYAYWEVIDYTITYVLDEGMNNLDNPESYNINDGIIELSKPQKTGYKFNGWYTDSNFENEIKEIDSENCEDITLYASWSLIDYTITYYLNGGKNNYDNPEGFTQTDEIIVLKEPERTGYKFLGWYLDSDFLTQITAIDPVTNQDYVIYAAWSLVNYIITYNLDDGTNSEFNPYVYNVEDEEIILYFPSKDGYQFDGWFKDSDFTEEVISIEAHSTGDISLYAKWIKGSQSILIFDADTGNIDISIESTDGNKVTLKADEGYSSYKWIYDDTVIDENTDTVTVEVSESGYHYITVLAYDENGLQYSAQCSIRRKDTQSSSSTEGGDSEGQILNTITLIPLVDDTDNVLISVSAGSTDTVFTATEGYDSYTWIVDDSVQSETTGTLTKNDFSYGYHIVTVICKKNGKSYSYTLTIRKTNSGNDDSEKTSGLIELIALTNDVSELPISVSSDSSKYTFSTDSGYSTYNWYIDDNIFLNESESITINKLSAGNHYISVLAVMENGDTVSSSITIRITDFSSDSGSEGDISEKTSAGIEIVTLTDDSSSMPISIVSDSSAYTFSVDSGCSSYNWYVDDSVYLNETNSITLSALTEGYHHISVLAVKDSGEKISSSCTVRITKEKISEGGDSDDSEKTAANIELIKLTDDTVLLPISISSDALKYTFSVASGYDNYIWYIDDNVLSDEGNSITLNNLSGGYHYIAVMAEKDSGEKVSSSCTVRVT